MPTVKQYLATIGRRGGLKSRRALDAETARRMVRFRELRRGAGARMQAAIALRRSAWMLTQSTLRAHHPDWTDSQLNDELRRRFSAPSA